MVSKWKQRYEQLQKSSMCKNVWPYLNIEPDGTVRVLYRHKCGDDCEYLKAVRGE